MDFIEFKIRKARPTLRDVSIKNYLNYLKALSKKVTQEEFKNLDFLKDFEKVNFFLQQYKFNTRRSILTACVVGLGATGDPYDNKKKYDKLLDTMRKELNIIKQNPIMTEKTKENWTTMKALLKKQNEWRKKVNTDDIPNRDTLSNRSRLILQNYLIASLYTLMPPRRHIYSSVELISTIKFKKLSKVSLQRNYLVFSKALRKVFFHFGYQKSSNESIKNAYQKPPKKMIRILKLYLRFNRDKQWLLYNRMNEPLGANALGIQIKKLLGVGTTMIRKIYITEHTGGAHKTITDLASKMGHSTSVAKSSYLQTTSASGKK